MLKRISLVMLIAFMLIGSLYAKDLKLVMNADVASGSGTNDNIGDIPGIQTPSGITLYIGYLEGDYDSSVDIASCKPLNNADSPAELSILKPEGSDLFDTVTIYVAADSNVDKEKSINIRFSPVNGGWVLENEGGVSFVVPIEGNIETIALSQTESNVTASKSADDVLTLTASIGGPKGDETPIVAYNVLSWENDGNVIAGGYSAEIQLDFANQS